MEQVNIRLLEPSTKRQQTSNGSDVFKFVMNCVYYGDQVRPDFVTLQYASLDLSSVTQKAVIDLVDHAVLCLFVSCSRTDPLRLPNAKALTMRLPPSENLAQQIRTSVSGDAGQLSVFRRKGP
jgi:hypothetical protein